MDRDFLTLGLISSIVAHDIPAAEAMLLALVPIDPRWAESLIEAMRRGNTVRAASVTSGDTTP